MERSVRRRRILVAVTALYIMLITVLSLIRISPPQVDMGTIGFDKLVHACLYFGLNVLLLITTMAYRGVKIRREVVVATVAATLYGVAIELIQSVVGREFDLYDIVANTAGAILALVVVYQPSLANFIRRILLK